METHITDTTETSEQVTLTINLPANLLTRIESYTSKLENELHIDVSQSGVILRLLSMGLDDAERVLEVAKSLKSNIYAEDK